VVAVKYESHWHEPDRERMLISVQRLAEMLGLEIWAAYGLAHALDCRYYTEGGHHLRVTMASVRRYQELRAEHGDDALEVLRQEKELGWSPTLERGISPRSWNHLQRRRRRRGW
jgi:hypothetical protein